MNVVHIITSTAQGGAENHLLTLASNQRKHGHRVTVIALSSGPDYLDKFFISNGIEIIHIPLINKLYSISCVLNIIRSMKPLKPDIIHTHLLPANILGGIAAKYLKTPHVSSKHNDERQIKNNIFWRLIHSLASKFFDDAVICISKHVALYMEKYGIQKNKVKIVYYAFDKNLYKISTRNIRSEYGIQKDTFLIGIVARITPQKGHMFLIRAFERFLSVNKNAHLLIVGACDSSSVKDDLVSYIKDRKLENHITFTGQSHDAYSFINAFDIFVLPSLWEGFGLVILEAISLFKPIIASRVSAVPEIMNNDNGILIPPASVDRLFDALCYCYHNIDLLRAKAKYASLPVLEKFSVDEMILSTTNIYKSVLKGSVK